MALDVVGLTQELIAFRTPSSVSNIEAAHRVASLLTDMGATVEELPYTDRHGVDKLSLVARLGDGDGGLSLMGHLDTVPADVKDGWSVDPFAGDVRGGRLYGRGACDMKGGVAATLCAAARFAPNQLRQPLFLVITSDEEVQARGAREIVAASTLFAAAASGWGIICEPTGLRVVHAHKGALTMIITARGKAAHTSTLKGVNANIRMIPFLQEMKEIYDRVLSAEEFRNDEFDPPHSEWSLGINDHNRALNMCPTRSICTVNYRPMPGIDTAALIAETRSSAARNGLEFELVFHGEPVYTPPDSPLVRLALEVTQTPKAHNVPYGTDGLALVEKMRRMIVLGPGDIAQAHTVDEWVDVPQLLRSVEIYADLIQRVCVLGHC